MTNEVMARMEMVLKKEDMDRIKVSGNKIQVDFHGLGTKDALILLNNVINLNRNSCDIEAIHGYNHGTCLKEMINQRFRNPRIQKRIVSEANPGVTFIKCMAQC